MTFRGAAMEKLIERVLERAGLAGEDELSECGSVNLPDAAQPYLDLTPAEIVAALRAGDVDKLSQSKTVWLSGWEPQEKLRRVLAALRGILNERPSAPEAGRFYRDVGEQLGDFGRIQHGRLLSWSGSGEDPATSPAQRLALRLRLKIKGGAGTAGDMDELGKCFSGGSR